MKEILTVTELNEKIKNLLESSFEFLWVEGEISNLHQPTSGHIYFTLKDQKSQIRAVIFRSPLGQRTRYVAFDFEEGMMIICRARLSVYQPRGEYQLIVETVEPRGIGALQKAFEQLKARLQGEGLFDDSHKKRIPFLPEKIGVITSLTGAVLKDILNITKRRFPSVNIIIAPARVQGEEASAEIIQAIENMHAFGNIDVIILARGGGSLEDLAPFNDERLAREIHSSQIPIISAIGHETDFTIADFVADLRTPTPSAAAELVVPMKRDLITSIESLHLRIVNHYRRMMEALFEKIQRLESALKDPGSKIDDLRLALDDRLERMKWIMNNLLAAHRGKMLNIELRFYHLNPFSKIQSYRLILENFIKSIISEFRNSLEHLRKKVDSDMVMLDSLSPMAILKRGYSITKTLPEGFIVKTAEAVDVGKNLDIKVSSGSLQARVTHVYKE